MEIIFSNRFQIRCFEKWFHSSLFEIRSDKTGNLQVTNREQTWTNGGKTVLKKDEVFLELTIFISSCDGKREGNYIGLYALVLSVKQGGKIVLFK